MSSHLVAQAKYYDLRSRYDVAHRTSQEAHRAMKAAEAELVEALIEANVSAMTLGDGTSISLRNQASISVTEKNEGVVRDFLMAEVGDDELFTKQTLDKPAIMEMITTRVQDGDLAETDVPAEMKLKLRPAITVRGWNARRTEQ
jgi:3-oxoacyl-ACP reductase-like protein